MSLAMIDWNYFLKGLRTTLIVNIYIFMYFSTIKVWNMYVYTKLYVYIYI